MNQDFNTPDALPQGTTIGQDYTILRVLGQGGFGITYLAHDEMMGGEVVIKENMPGDFAARDRDTLRLTPRPRQEENYTWARERFLDEARLLHKLHHPNIVPVSRAFSALNTAYYVMPHVGATELGEAVRNNPDGRSEAYLAPLLRQLLDALTYLHGEKLLHRDLKPSNILMSEKGVPIIIDFGSARATVSGRTHTMLESPGYTPYEQVITHGKVGAWTDLYSLGATFYKLITGSLPPRGIDRLEDNSLYHHLASRPELQNRFSRRFLASIDKALEVRPVNRWQTAAEWANDLPAVKTPTKKTTPKFREINTTPEPLDPEPSPAPQPTQNKLLVGISLVSILLLLLAVGYIFMLQHGSSPTAQPTTTQTPATAQAPAAAAPQPTMAEEPQEQQTTETETPQPQEQQQTPQQQPVAQNRPRTISSVTLLRESQHGGDVYSVAFSPDSNSLAIGVAGAEDTCITGVTTSNTIQKIRYEHFVFSVAFSPDGKFLAIGELGGSVRITEVATGNTIREIKHSDDVKSVAFSPDGKYLATGGFDNTARITEVATGNTIREIKHDNWVMSVAFSPDGRYLATGGFDKTARITEVATGNTIKEIKHDNWVMSVAFSPDGRYLAIGSLDGTVRITEVATGRTIRFIKHNYVNSVAFSPDGRYLATGGFDKTARITEIATGNTIKEIKHSDDVRSVAFSPDGRYLATGSRDTTARIYELKETEE